MKNSIMSIAACFALMLGCFLYVAAIATVGKFVPLEHVAVKDATVKTQASATVKTASAKIALESNPNVPKEHLH